MLCRTDPEGSGDPDRPSSNLSPMEMFNNIKATNGLLDLFESPEELDELEASRLLDLVGGFDQPAAVVA